MARMPTFMEIGERIRALRTSKGYDQAHLAKELGVSRPVVTKIENGNKAINSIELRKIADLLAVSVDELTRPVEEETLVAKFRQGHDDASFLQAVNSIEYIFKTMITQISLRSNNNA
ncbi:helix-turn-helix transcriptional regulator [Peptococcaceae bacterium 1198_IL3148]